MPAPPPSPDAHAPHISLVAGILIGLAASAVQSLGLTIQRKSHVQNELRPPLERRSEWRRPLWVVGFAIFITSNTLGTVFQIGALPIVVLAPLGAVSLLWNAFFARLLLSSFLSPLLLLGTALISLGAVLIALFGIVPEPTRGLDELLKLYARPAFLAYFGALAVGLLGVLALAHVLEWRLARTHIRSRSRSASFHSHSHFGTPKHPLTPSSSSSERTPLLIQAQHPAPLPHAHHTRTRLAAAVIYGAASGTLSGMCLLFAKSGIELLVLTLVAGKNQFGRWESWAIVGVLLVAALLQLWYLNKSLRLADPTLICPLAFCFYNISSILNGLVYFDQFSLLTARQFLLVCVGMVTLLGGVWIVSLKEEVEVGEPDIAGTALPFTTEPEQDALEDLEDAVLVSPPLSPRSHRQSTSSVGFSIGLGASSPGFVLRRGRTKSVNTSTAEERAALGMPRSVSLGGAGMDAGLEVGGDVGEDGDKGGARRESNGWWGGWKPSRRRSVGAG